MFKNEGVNEDSVELITDVSTDELTIKPSQFKLNPG